MSILYTSSCGKALTSSPHSQGEPEACQRSLEKALKWVLSQLMLEMTVAFVVSQLHLVKDPQAKGCSKVGHSDPEKNTSEITNVLYSH